MLLRNSSVEKFLSATLPFFALPHTPSSGADKATRISILSKSGAEKRRQYCSIARGAHKQILSEQPKLPQGQGFAASKSWKRAGYSVVLPARLKLTFPSSSGTRSACKTEMRNSEASSKNKTPLCAKEISPGRQCVPPPIIPSSVELWCGMRNGGSYIIFLPEIKLPARL